MHPFPPWWPLERNVMRWRRMEVGKRVFVKSVVMVLCSTLTSQVIGSSRGDGERWSGAHCRCLLAIYRQHGKVLLGDQTYCVPLAIVKPWTWRGGAECKVPSENANTLLNIMFLECKVLLVSKRFGWLTSWNNTSKFIKMQHHILLSFVSFKTGLTHIVFWLWLLTCSLITQKKSRLISFTGSELTFLEEDIV